MVADADENDRREANSALPNKNKVYGGERESAQKSEKKSLYEDIFNVDNNPKPYGYKN